MGRRVRDDGVLTCGKYEGRSVSELTSGQLLAVANSWNGLNTEPEDTVVMRDEIKSRGIKGGPYPLMLGQGCERNLPKGKARKKAPSRVSHLERKVKTLEKRIERLEEVISAMRN